MNADDIIKLLGKPQSNPEIQKLLSNYNSQLSKPKFYIETLFHDKITLEFRVDFSYDRDYHNIIHFPDGDPPVPFDPKIQSFEWKLEQISFSDDFPFGLNKYSTKNDIKNQFNIYQKPSSNFWLGLKDDFELGFMFDEVDNQEVLCRIDIKKQSIYLKEKLEILSNLKKQRKNINPNNIEDIYQYDKQRPTIKWRKNINQLKIVDKDFYSIKNLNNLDKIFDKFLLEITRYTTKRNTIAIYNSVKQFINSLNKLEDKYGYISTDEREQIIPFILKMVSLTGLQFDYDITEDWRNW